MVSRGEEEARDGQSLREFVQEDRQEYEHAERRAHPERARDRHAVHERVKQQPHQRRDAHDRGDLVRLLAEVEVGGEGVLGEVHEDVAKEGDEGGRAPPAGNGLRKDVGHRRRDHEAGREGDHRLERARAPFPPPGDGGCPEDVRRRGDDSQGQRGPVHAG
jgi:hypothetical protein